MSHIRSKICRLLVLLSVITTTYAYCGGCTLSKYVEGIDCSATRACNGKVCQGGPIKYYTMIPRKQYDHCSTDMVVNTTESLLGMQKAHIITDSHPLHIMWGCNINIARNTFLTPAKWNKQFLFSNTSDCTCGAKADAYQDEHLDGFGTDYNAAVYMIGYCCIQAENITWHISYQIIQEYMIGYRPHGARCAISYAPGATDHDDLPLINNNDTIGNHSNASPAQFQPVSANHTDNTTTGSNDGLDDTGITLLIVFIVVVVIGAILFAAFLYHATKILHAETTDIDLQQMNV